LKLVGNREDALAKKEFYYEHILNDISGKIECGEYRYQQYLPSEREMAGHYQVNRTTVRKALDLLVEREYIAKRQGASSQVVYKKDSKLPNSEERIIGFFLRGGKNKDIRLEQSFYMSLYYYIEMRCREYNCRVVCITITDLKDFISLTKKYSFSGAFFMSKIRGDVVKYARSIGIPAVAINEKFPDMPCITMDNVNGGYLAVKYLLDHGHRKIAFITGPDKYFTSEDRMLGAGKAMNEYQIPLESVEVAMADWTFAGGYGAMQELLKQPEDAWPTAVFAFNEEMAHGAVKALEERRVRVPEDMSMIGFENTSVYQQRENLTMVDGNLNLMAKTASTVLMNLMERGGLDQELVILLPVKVVECNSVKTLS